MAAISEAIERAQQLLRSVRKGLVEGQVQLGDAVLLEVSDDGAGISPGNIRELHNILERGVVLSGAEEIGLGDLRPPDGTPGNPSAPGYSLQDAVETATEAAVRAALAASKNVPPRRGQVAGCRAHHPL